MSLISSNFETKLQRKLAHRNEFELVFFASKKAYFYAEFDTILSNFFFAKAKSLSRKYFVGCKAYD